MSLEKQSSANDWNNFWEKSFPQNPSKMSWSKQRILRILKPHIKKDGWALDAGCGSGFFSKYFCDEGMRTVSLDYSREALALTQRVTEGRAVAIQQDLLMSDLSSQINQRFDLIFTDGLLEHFEVDQQKQIINNLCSLLSGNGCLINFVPNRWSPWELIRPIYMPGINETPLVLTTFISLHQIQGLHIVNFGGINVLPFRFSPERLLGKYFGMLLFVVAQKK